MAIAARSGDKETRRSNHAPLNLPQPGPFKHAREPAAPHEPAHRIASDAEALAIARQLAKEFAEGSAERDRERLLPFSEVERFSQSGLWGISVPKEYGGAGVPVGTLAEVTALISAADASLGQIPQNHYYMVEAIRLAATEQQKRFYFERVLERCGSIDRRRRGESAVNGGGSPRLEQALRADWIALDPAGIQFRPSPAERADAYATRPCSLQIRQYRELFSERSQASSSWRALNLGAH
jgi:Acyl-CoA dehydrogenase, N-terminal domain